jgi:hypothetical protein
LSELRTRGEGVVSHLLINTCFALHRHRTKRFSQMNHFYYRIYNIKNVQSWDPVAVHNDLFHNNVNWGDYHSTLVNEGPVSPSRRSVSPLVLVQVIIIFR